MLHEVTQAANVSHKIIRELLYAVTFMNMDPALWQALPLTYHASACLPALAILSLWPRVGNGGLNLTP